MGEKCGDFAQTHRISRTSIDPDGKPVVLSSGYASVRSAYDKRGKFTHTTYYGVSGEPVLHKDANHGWVAEYDERGNETARTFIGVDGKPLP
jgi:hypothetical protein